jgi:hypothetical protein
MEAREYIRAGAETTCFIAVSLTFVYIISLACFWLEAFSDLLREWRALQLSNLTCITAGGERRLVRAIVLYCVLVYSTL